MADVVAEWRSRTTFPAVMRYSTVILLVVMILKPAEAPGANGLGDQSWGWSCRWRVDGECLAAGEIKGHALVRQLDQARTRRGKGSGRGVGARSDASAFGRRAVRTLMTPRRRPCRRTTAHSGVLRCRTIAGTHRTDTVLRTVGAPQRVPADTRRCDYAQHEHHQPDGSADPEGSGATRDNDHTGP
jgi:hypothetical protein